MKKSADLIAQFAQAKNEFRAGKQSRFSSSLPGVSSLGSGADYHYKNESQFLRMIELARHFERNDMIVGQAIRRLTANVIQDGFSPDPDTGDSHFDEHLKYLWSEWSRDADACHSEGEFNFKRIERLAFQSIVRDGDLVILPLRSGAIQPIEAHRIRTPRNTRRNVVHGVLMDSKARRTEYWITREDLDPHRSLAKVSDVKQYPVRDAEGNRQVLHLYFPCRFSQRRGITALAPVAETVGMHDDVQFTTMVKAQMAAMVALFRKRDKQAPSIPGAALNDALIDENGSIRQLEGVAAGLDITGAPGEELQGFAPNVPSPSFFEHSRMLLQFIAVNLDLPLHVLLLDPSQTNFSGWRGAIDQARFRFRELQQDMVDQLHRPIWNWKVRQWIAIDPAVQAFAATSGVNPFKHKWKIPGFPYIDPDKDGKADERQHSALLNSLRRIHGARGADVDELLPEIVNDRGRFVELCIEKAAELNQRYPDASVDWRTDIKEFTSGGSAITENQQQLAENIRRDERVWCPMEPIMRGNEADA